ncbi:uncharacterized protein L969DRAFT_512964 [Mixia osmundae IAM 14324]|uniref:uncharacterized protein n=1 Tax=Mixia osmundae (strain CBS 9802 / IAM 14324 / JCM 22182 / KY 12970) TaxID=764103 RepID=UPI0004A54DE7|nr:uncharacterized protein L969DRAFT_512964 [Mixia osmundae IAM 14324]KEI39115.1 hypothetical protein L969DRAFT_512964 [Mixia osmundae IAM 14324]
MVPWWRDDQDDQIQQYCEQHLAERLHLWRGRVIPNFIKARQNPLRDGLPCSIDNHWRSVSADSWRGMRSSPRTTKTPMHRFCKQCIRPIHITCNETRFAPCLTEKRSMLLLYTIYSHSIPDLLRADCVLFIHRRWLNIILRRQDRAWSRGSQYSYSSMPF